MPKYLRLASDIHLDFDADSWKDLPNYHPDKLARVPELDRLWFPEPLAEDHDSVMLIPGDIWLNNQAFRRRYASNEAWIERLAKQFHTVILLLGNHDYWSGFLNRAPTKAKESIKDYGLTNVHLLERDTIVVDDVKYVGGTLWTDYNKHNPLIMQKAIDYMNDFKYIRYAMVHGGNAIARTLSPSDIYKDHIETRKYLLANARRDHDNQKVVILSHHAPSFESIAPEFRNTSQWDASFFYYSELGWDLCADEVQADLWVHGHCHRASDYMIDRTRVLCNPRGYYGHETPELTGFDPTLRLEVAHLRSAELPEAERPELFSILDKEHDDEEDANSMDR